MAYNLTREQAAEILWISTRTLDRRIRKWILSHEKRSNKVFLSESEVKNYKKHNEVENIILDSSISTKLEDNNRIIDTNEIVEKIWKHMENSMWKFLTILSEKDKKLEEKNKIIFGLQHRIWELETKLKNMIALPLYEEEKNKLLLEKEKLQKELELEKNRIKEEEKKIKEKLLLEKNRIEEELKLEKQKIIMEKKNIEAKLKSEKEKLLLESKQKEELFKKEKEKIELEKKQIEEKLKKEKIRNIVIVGLVVILVIIMLFIIWR